MRKHEVVGQLRRLGVWSLAQKAHRLIGPPVAGAVHSLVVRSGTRLFSTDLVLKHIYDDRPLWFAPEDIQISVKVGGWRRRDIPQTRREVARSWYLLGDGLKSSTRHVSRNLHGRFIAGGDWDLQASPFEVLPVVEQLFVEGRPPNESDLYLRYRDQISSGRLAWTKGLRSDQDLEDHFAGLVAIYEDMRSNGYRLQTELGANPSDEIRVCVDRTGRPCLYGGGSHRLSMAKLLRLERVPVIVKRVHRVWVDDLRLEHADDDIKAVELGLRHLESAAAGHSKVPPDRAAE